MNWSDPLIALLHADFGGFPTFCHDPDRLLDIPLAREAIRADGFRIEEWDGKEENLQVWQNVPTDLKPCIIVHDIAARLKIESNILNHRWLSISISDLFVAFAPEIIRELPIELWNQVYAVGKTYLRRLDSVGTLDCIGRTIYGLDPQHLRFGEGWWRAWLEVVADEQGWPLAIAQWAAKSSPSPYIDTERLIETLTKPDKAHLHLLAMQREQPHVVEELSPLIRASIERFAPVNLPMEPAKITGILQSKITANPSKKLIHFDLENELGSQRSPYEVLDFACRFARDLALDLVPDDIRLQADSRFVIWLQTNYKWAMTATGPKALSLPKLVNQLDEETGQTPMLLAVVDSLSLRAWQIVKEVWLGDRIIQSYEERAAMAVLPTITSFSRRAIFEGKLPSYFGSERHTQSLERKLWNARFGVDGDYFAPVEHLGISDAFAMKRRRVAVVDVQWDKKGHAIDPRFDTIEEEARKWASRSDMRQVIQRALQQGYRVVLTSDHGHITCNGIGRPNTGETVSDRSKRCLVFKSEGLRERYAPARTIQWTPVGLDEDMHPLFAAGFDSFDYNGSRGVSHGGLSLEEAIVPVISLA